MQTVERPSETLGEPLRRTNRYLVGALAFLVLLAVGFGTWLVIDEYTGVDREIELLVRDFYDAWDRGDGEGVLELMAPTARHYDPLRRATGIGGDALVDFVESLETYSFTTVGEPLISEASVYTYLVAQEGIISDSRGISVFRLRIVDDELRIYEHRWLG